MKNAAILAGLLILTTLMGVLRAFDPRTDTGSSRVARVVEPLVKPELTPLPPGEVEPRGWLRDWAMAAKDGITGHLDEWHPTFGDGWKGVPIKAPGAEPDGAGWPIEQCSYWLDGLVRLGYVLHDDALIQKAKSRLGPIVDGVNRGGASLIYWKQGKPSGFDSWAHSQMGRALVAWYQASGEKRILAALVKAYADYPVAMGNLEFTDVSGLCNVDAALETYAFSGDRRVLDRVLAAMRSSTAQHTMLQWRDGRFLPGHAVITYEDIRLPALLYPWNDDPRYLQASLNAYRWIEREHMLPYGLASGEEYMSGIGAFRKTETCNVAAGMWSMLWMYRILGQRGYGDAIERAFFNAGAAPIARDFQTMCYYQSPNRIRSDSLPCEQPHSPGPGAIRFHRLGCPNVLCCVGAVNRIVPNYIMHMWMATADQGLAATLYGPCGFCPRRPRRAGEVGVQDNVSLRGHDPRERRSPAQGVLSLVFSHPRLVRKADVTLNRAPLDAVPNQNGFLRISREWSAGDQVELRFPMPIEVVRGYETEFPSAVRQYFAFEPAAVFTQRRLPYASVSLGPLLFSLPIADRDANTPVPGASWQFALDTAAERTGFGIAVERPDATEVELAPGRPVEVKRSGPGDRLEPHGRPSAAGRAGGREKAAAHSPRSLRLHQVPHLDVPSDHKGMDVELAPW